MKNAKFLLLTFILFTAIINEVDGPPAGNYKPRTSTQIN
jgi:hypothetical protein